MLKLKQVPSTFALLLTRLFQKDSQLSASKILPIVLLCTIYLHIVLHMSLTIFIGFYLYSKAHEIHLVSNFTHVYVPHEKMNKNTKK
jgi:hypothetical protein